MSDWSAVHVGFQNDGLLIGNLDVWRQKWRPSGSTIQLAHPAYPNQSHQYEIYEIGDVDDPIRFAAGELSNGVWGFYVPNPAVSVSKASMRPGRPRLILGCLGAILVGVFALGIGGAWVCGYLPVQPFSSPNWKEPASEGVRLSMVDALVRTHRLEGMHRDEIVDLLGPPPDSDYFREWDAVYWLGPERGWIRIDSEWLVLRFGADDRVTEWAIVRD